MADAITTQKQELASLWIIKQALGQQGIKYQTVDQLKNDYKKTPFYFWQSSGRRL